MSSALNAGESGRWRRTRPYCGIEFYLRFFLTGARLCVIHLHFKSVIYLKFIFLLLNVTLVLYKSLSQWMICTSPWLPLKSTIFYIPTLLFDAKVENLLLGSSILFVF